MAGLIWPGQSKKLSEAIERFRAEILPTKEQGTQDAYSKHLDYWQAALGAYRLADISGQVLAIHRDLLAREDIARPPRPDKPAPPPKYRSPTTVNRYLATLGSLLTAVVNQWHWLPGSYVPMREVKKLKQPGGRKRFLSEEELQALLQGLPGIEIARTVCRCAAVCDDRSASGRNHGDALGVRGLQA